MSRAVADLKMSYPEYEIDVRSPCPAIWENNPHLTKLDEGAEDVEVFNIEYGRDGSGIHESGWKGQHWTDAYREDIENQLGVTIVKTGIWPELYISEKEKHWINQVETEFSWHGGFWLLNAGHKPDNELKQYHRWQEFVDLFNDHFKGSIRLVQVGHKSHVHPELNGAYNLIGKTDLRQFIRLCWWAHGTVGPLSFQLVMAAAFKKPHVVVAAGKEGIRWHIYPNGRYLHTLGALKCCHYDGCWKGGKYGDCVDRVYEIPRCFCLIKPQIILDAVTSYYEGGILGLERGI